ncbi:MAG: zinc-dependent metalloprotease [Acidobacteriota bacterium]
MVMLVGGMLAPPPATWAASRANGEQGSPTAVKDDEGVEVPSRRRHKKKKKEEGEKGKKEERKGKKGKSFADVIKGHDKIEGLLTVYRKGDEFLLAIEPGQFDHDYMLSVTRETGIGQSFLLAAQVLGENPVRFHRVGESVQLIMKNPRFTAHDDPQMQRAVDRSFSDSLIASTKIKSEPDPETKAVLVDMKPFFVTDVEAAGLVLGLAFKTPYSVDPVNSSLGEVKGYPRNVEIDATIHFRGKKPAPFVNLADPRSMFVTYHDSVSEIPRGDGFIPRIADDRVGHFLTLYKDFSDDKRESPYVRYITRWNLRKRDPEAELSRPVQPITYWLENSIPVKYRKAIADGTLMWNAAFARIGFKDAIVVKQQPDDATWEPGDARYSTVRWFVTTSGAFAIGPSRINPWTGEIYDADIGWAESLVSGRAREYEELSDPVGFIRSLFSRLSGASTRTGARFSCSLARGAAMQMEFGLDVLAQDGFDPDSDKAREYIAGFIRYVQAHECGHTLGLRHNFRSSVLNPVDDLQDEAAMRERGLTGSVMDYVPVNLAAGGNQQGPYWQESLGPYDYWAIAYAYSEFPDGGTPEGDLPHLREIAAKVADSGYQYGSDEDTSDPRTSVWDLGSDPLEFYSDRIGLVRKLWKEIPAKLGKKGEGYQAMRRSFGRSLAQYAFAAFNVPKMIGGMYTYRDHVNDPGGRLPMVPVPADRQRAAMRFLTEEIFAPDAFDAPADLLNRLGASRWWDLDFSIFRMARMEYPLHNVALAIQDNVLDALLNPVKLDRLVDLQMQFAPDDEPFTLAEMFDGLQHAIWAEVYRGATPRINSFRRGLQRAHLNRVIRLLLAPPRGTPDDATMMARANLSDLRERIDRMLQGKTVDLATRAHLDETRARIDAALSATILRLAG